MKNKLFIGIILALLIGVTAGWLIFPSRKNVGKTVQSEPEKTKLLLGQRVRGTWNDWYYTGMPDDVRGTFGLSIDGGYNGAGFTLWFQKGYIISIEGNEYRIEEFTPEYVILRRIS